SKMGISTIQSYLGPQVFEILGLDNKFVKKYFTRTPSRIGGIGLDEIAKESLARHKRAFFPDVNDDTLDTGGKYQCGGSGEDHRRSARSACDSHEPYRRPEQYRRGRRGCRSFRKAGKWRQQNQQDKTSGIRAVWRNEPLPGQRRGASDKARPGSQTGRGRAAS